MTTVNLGRVQPIDRGVYDPAYMYKMLDFVSNDDLTGYYTCIADVLVAGTPLTDTAFFRRAIGQTELPADLIRVGDLAQSGGTDPDVAMSQKAVMEAIAAAGGGSAVIKTPSIISPATGATDTDLQLVVEGSPFEVLDGAETLDGAIFEYRDFNGEVVFISPKTAAEVIYETPRYVLNPLNTYSVRVLYIGVIYGASAWSAPVTFSTSDISIATPAIIEPEEGAVDVPEQPIFESSVFTMASGEAFFDGLQFRVRDENDDVVHLSPKITYYEYAPPAGVLQDGKSKYKVDTKHFGQGVNPSAWSNAVSFTTMESFLPSEPGEPFGGGFFVALYNHSTDGRSALIDAGAAGDLGAMQWKTSNTATAGTDDLTDGQANTAAMIAAGKALHPAAAACVDYRGGGHDDWFLDAKNQLELKYRYLKPFTQANSTSYGTNTAAIPPTGNYTASVPAQTTVANYKKGATDAFTETTYWSSTQYSTDDGWNQIFDTGLQYYITKNTSRHVRASRSIKV